LEAAFWRDFVDTNGMRMNRFIWQVRPRLSDFVEAESAAAAVDKRFYEHN